MVKKKKLAPIVIGKIRKVIYHRVDSESADDTGGTTWMDKVHGFRETRREVDEVVGGAADRSSKGRVMWLLERGLTSKLLH